MSEFALCPCDAEAMILAGGRGSRLQTVVSDRPKVLADVCGRPFLSYLLDQMAAAGFSQVILCTGFMASSVETAFGQEYKGMRLRYSPEDEPLGTGGALRQALALVKSPTVLAMNGDSICQADLVDFWNAHFSAGAEASILLTQVPDVSRYGRVDLADSGEVLGFQEKGRPGPGCINAGVYVLARRVLENIPAGEPVSIERQVFPSLIGKGLFGRISSGRFLDIGTPESYGRAKEFLANWEPANRTTLR